jgi:transcriptional regulator with XRE-family HTH domain
MHNASARAQWHIASMTKAAKNPPNTIRAWREFRGLSQEQLAAAAGTSPGMIHQLESGDRGLNTRWLARLAPALDTTPGALVDQLPQSTPVELPIQISDAWSRATEIERTQLISVAEALIPFRHEHLDD